MIYLDNAATTKPKEEVMNVIAKSMREDWFNPSSPYFPAFDVKNKIERARETIASAIRARPNEILPPMDSLPPSDSSPIILIPAPSTRSPDTCSGELIYDFVL